MTGLPSLTWWPTIFCQQDFPVRVIPMNWECLLHWHERSFQAPASSLGMEQSPCALVLRLLRGNCCQHCPCALGGCPTLLRCFFCISYSALHSGQNLLKSWALVSDHEGIWIYVWLIIQKCASNKCVFTAIQHCSCQGWENPAVFFTLEVISVSSLQAGCCVTVCKQKRKLCR